MSTQLLCKSLQVITNFIVRGLPSESGVFESIKIISASRQKKFIIVFS
jgi:hypothetical protein